MVGSQRIEQLALHMSAGQAIQFLLDLNLHQFAQFVDAFEPESSSQAVVQLGFSQSPDFANDNVKGRSLSCEILGAIIVGEGDVQNLAVIGFHADQLVFKSGDQLARTDFDRHGFAFAAIKRHAIDLAFKVDDHDVTLGSFVALCRSLEIFVVLGQTGDCRINFFAFRFNGEAFELEPGNFGSFDFRKDFSKWKSTTTYLPGA